MINSEPTRDQLEELWDICSKFIKDNTVSCPESICQNDNVIENAYDFIEEICNVVGYFDDEEEI